MMERNEVAQEMGKVIHSDEWSFEKAEQMANSFPTPLHRSFQKTCEYVKHLHAEIHKLRGKLSHYEQLEPWNK